MPDQVIIRNGKFMRRDQVTGKFVPASEKELDVIQQGAIGTARAFAEGFLPIQGILEQFGVLDEGGSAALGTVAPGATLTGQASGAAAAVAGGAQLMRAGLGMVRSISGGVTRSTQTTGRIKIISEAADEGPIPVPRDIGELVPGVPQGPIEAVVKGTGAVLQGVVNQSKILSRVAGTRNPSVGRQVAANLAGIRGTTLRARDFGTSGKLPRSALKRATDDTDKLFKSALPEEFAEDIVVISTLRQNNLLNAITKAPKAERELVKKVLSPKEVKQGVMTNKQLLQRHKELRRIAAKTENELTRDAVNEVTAELEFLMEESTGIATDILQAAKEQWRFDQMLVQSLEKHGQLNYDRLIAQAKKFFPREFTKGDVAGESARKITLSQKGQDAINTLIDIENAGGVSLPSKDVSAVDWILVLSTLAGGTLGTAGTF
jgi:hypothetical protein